MAGTSRVALCAATRSAAQHRSERRSAAVGVSSASAGLQRRAGGQSQSALRQSRRRQRRGWRRGQCESSLLFCNHCFFFLSFFFFFWNSFSHSHNRSQDRGLGRRLAGRLAARRLFVSRRRRRGGRRRAERRRKCARRRFDSARCGSRDWGQSASRRFSAGPARTAAQVDGQVLCSAALVHRSAQLVVAGYSLFTYLFVSFIIIIINEIILHWSFSFFQNIFLCENLKERGTLTRQVLVVLSYLGIRDETILAKLREYCSALSRGEAWFGIAQPRIGTQIVSQTLFRFVFNSILMIFFQKKNTHKKVNVDQIRRLLRAGVSRHEPFVAAALSQLDRQVACFCCVWILSC